MIDHSDLVERLELLGDAMNFDDVDLAGAVLVDVRERRSRVRARRWLVAAGVLLVVGAVASYPDSRQAVARWFGFDSLSVEVDPELSVPAAEGPFEAAGPGETLVVDVDGRPITVSTVVGRLNTAVVAKTVGSIDQIEEVTVQGRDGLWISGAPHQVGYESPDGSIVVERVAQNTLVWQSGDVLVRVEGFVELSDALAFVDGT